MTNLDVRPPDSFSQLIARFAAGEVEAFGEFHRALLPEARAVARRIVHDHFLVEDAVQEASIKAWYAAPRFCPGDGRAWYLRIVRNTALNIAAKRAHVDIVDPDDLVREAGRGGAAVTQDVAAQLAAIRREPWFCRLAPREQQIVALRYLGFRNGEILRRLPGVTHNEIIRRALARAARNLREATAGEALDELVG